MMQRHSLNTVAWTIAWLLVAVVDTTTSAETPFSEPVPNWIWSPEHTAGHIPQLTCYFRRVVRIAQPASGEISVAADDAFELFINGQRVGDGTSDQGIYTFDVGPFLHDGSNVIAIRVSNRKGGTAGLATRLVVHRRNQQRAVFASDASWRTSLSVLPLWNRASYSDRRWKAAKSIGVFSDFVVRQQRDAAARGNPRQAIADNKPATPASGERKPDRQSSTTSVRPSAAARKLTGLPAAIQHLDVPREFQLEQIAGHRDVGSLIAMTFNEAGQIVASRESGSLVLIDDRDKDGKFDSIRDYCQSIKSCQGLLAMNGQVFAVGMGPSGSALYRLSDIDHDGFLDKAQAIVKFEGENVEHGPHGLSLGADGLIYVIVGNHSKLQSPAADTSPHRHFYEGDLIQPKIEDPGGHATNVKAPGGFILRTDTEGRQVEIVAGGLRNPYDLAINAQGEIFTHDSDMESDEGTTWFRPTRLYHVTPGAEFGWRSGWSKWPDYYIDTLPGIADTGRGSPTGIVVYDHHGFPAGYRNRLFSCDWSEGRILMFRLHEEGASYRATPETFIRGEPLNVTDIEVGPDGALYFCTGGRGTAGNIYRVSWKGHDSKRDQPGQGIDLALRQPQINSSWARQNIARVKRQLGNAWKPTISTAALDPQRPTSERTQALRIMHWLDGTPDLELLETLSRDQDVEMRRQATYFLGMIDDAASSQRLISLLRDEDPVVRRRACEALVRVRQVPSFDRLSHLFAASDRFELWSARRLLEQIPRRQWQEKILSAESINLFLHGATAMLVVDPNPEIATSILQRTFRIMDGFITDEHFTSMLRVQQLALSRGQINPKSVPSLTQRLAQEYPSSSQTINRELVRLLVYAQVTSIMDRYLQELESDSISPADRYHLAMHLARLKSGWTTEQKMAVFRRLEAPDEGGTNLPGFLQAVAMEFGKSLTAEETAYFLEHGDQYPSAAMSALLRLPDQLTARHFEQIKALDEKLANQTGETRKRLKIAIVAVLARDGSAPSLAYLRHVYQRDPARRVEIALGLAEHPAGENWEVLVRSLAILDNSSAKQVVARLKSQTRWPKNSPEAYRNVILLAERLGDQGADDAIALLEHWQGFGASDDRISWQKALVAWKSWYVETFPNEPAPEHTVTNQGGKWEYDSLLRHLTRAEEEGIGSAERGRSVFVKAQCANCHRHDDQGDAMGPDLTGVTRRFLKREILESIIYPSKVISDQYAARVVTTVDGQSYLGIVAPGAADELVVLMTNGQKVRIPETEIDEIEPSRSSAMPEGTLDQLTLDEITDLFVYMSTSGRRLSQRSNTQRPK